MKTSIQKLIRYPAVIKLLINYPDRNFTPLEISKSTRIPYTTIWRYTRDLKKLGVILSEKIGEYNVCRLNKTSPLLNKLKDFVKLELSPHWIAIKEFLKQTKKLSGIEKIILFGSVAKGKEDLTSDIDIAVMVRKRNKNLEKRISEIAGEIAERSRMIIIPLILTPTELKESKESKQFAKELEKGRILYERNR